MQERGGFKCLSLIGILVIIPSPANPIFFVVTEHVFGSTESGPGRTVYLHTQYYVRSINSSMTNGMFVCTCNNITCCVVKQKARASQNIVSRGVSSTNYAQKYQLKWQNGIKDISESCGFVSQ